MTESQQHGNAGTTYLGKQPGLHVAQARCLCVFQTAHRPDDFGFLNIDRARQQNVV